MLVSVCSFLWIKASLPQSISLALSMYLLTIGPCEKQRRKGTGTGTGHWWLFQELCIPYFWKRVNLGTLSLKLEWGFNLTSSKLLFQLKRTVLNLASYHFLPPWTQANQISEPKISGCQIKKPHPAQCIAMWNKSRNHTWRVPSKRAHKFLLNLTYSQHFLQNITYIYDLVYFRGEKTKAPSFHKTRKSEIKVS